MSKIILFVLGLLVFSCNNGFHSPTAKEIEQAAMDMYEKRNQADGGGGWKVKEIKILRSWKGDDERHYNAEVVVKGVHTSPPLPELRADKDFEETTEVKLTWRDGGWIGVVE